MNDTVWADGLWSAGVWAEGVWGAASEDSEDTTQSWRTRARRALASRL